MAGKTQRELAFLLTGRDVSATRAMKGVNKELGKLGGIASKAGSNVARNVERGVLLGTTAAIGAIGFAIEQAKDFESSSASVRKTVEKNADAIIAANRALSTDTGFDVNELNEIAATAGALDVAAEDIAAFTETVALLGITTDDVTTELGATSLGHLKTNLGLAGDEFERVGNTLVFLGNNGASTEGQILVMSEAISGAAGIMGATEAQVLGWASAVANTGEEAEAGGSSIQRFWLESFKNVQKGGKELKLMAKISGQTVASFTKDFGKDATGTLAKFIGKLGKLTKAEQAATLEALGFTDIRITRALLKLLGNTDNLTDSLGQAEQGWRENNAMTKEAEVRLQTTEYAMKRLEANVRDAAITIGTELLPVLADLAEEGVDWLQDHQPEIRAFAQDLAKGARDTVTWLQSLDWDAIGTALEAGAGAAKGIIDAFAGAPPWLQQLLAGGFVANKLTGGAVGDLVGELGKGLIKGVLGMTAGVVNINAGVVNSGGVPGVPGAGGGKNLLKEGIKFVLPIAVGVLIANAIREAAGITPEESAANRANFRAPYRPDGPANTAAANNAAPINPAAFTGPIVKRIGDTEPEMRAIQAAIRSAQSTASMEVARSEGAAARHTADLIGTTRSEEAATRMAVNAAAAAVRTVPPAVAHSASLLAGTTRSESAGIRMAARSTTSAVNAKRWQITIPVNINNRFSVSGRDLFSATQKQGHRQTIR